jgi:hypothetical protein|tara:strand:+ start:2453 stop:2770 length:318 start_codon:yes stop_codon:yes gene_type:complete
MNGVRPQKKLSQNQLTQSLVELSSRVHALSMATANDMQRTNILLFTLLKELGKVDEVKCESCDVINLRPIMEGIEVNPMCVECGARIDPLPEEAFKGEMLDDSEE